MTQPVLADRVRDVTNAPGTGTVTLNGTPPTGFQTFAAAVASGSVVPYCIQDQASASGQTSGANWEVGWGTFTSPNQLARTTVLASSNAGVAVNFTASAQDVFLTIPAEAAVILNTSGQIAGIWIPRTGNLAALQALAGNQGELASAIDIPAIVQFTGSAGGALTTYPFNSAAALAVAGTGSVNEAIPCSTDIVRISVASAVTALVGTIANGYIDGQELEIDLVSTPGTLTVTINGYSFTDINVVSIPGTNPIVRTFWQWNASTAAWNLAGSVATQRPSTDSAGSVVYGFGNSVSGASVTIGYGNTLTGVRSVALGAAVQTLGDLSLGFGYNTACYGYESLAFSGGQAAADYSIALGQGQIAQGYQSVNIGAQGLGLSTGPYSVCLNSSFLSSNTSGYQSIGFNGGSTGNQNQPFDYTAVSGTVTNPVFTVPSLGSAPFNLEVGQNVAVSSNKGGLFLSGQISSISGTSVTCAMTQTSNTEYVPTGYPSSGLIYECSSGSYGVGNGPGSQPLNYGEHATAPFYFASSGDCQAVINKLGIQTSGTTPTILTTTGTAVNTKKAFGNSNRFIVAPGQVVGGAITITAKQNGSANCAKWTYDFLFVNNGGTISIATSLNKALGIGSTQWSSTWVGTPPITFSGNNTYQSVDISVVGLTSTSINWSATMEVADSTTTAS